MAGRLQYLVSSERRECGLAVGDLEERLGQSERLRQQRSIWEVEQPELKLN